MSTTVAYRFAQSLNKNDVIQDWNDTCKQLEHLAKLKDQLATKFDQLFTECKVKARAASRGNRTEITDQEQYYWEMSDIYHTLAYFWAQINIPDVPFEAERLRAALGFIQQHGALEDQLELFLE